ncbi:hypothetical protein RHGRI_008949 [Rhododendron griersonianum]|uniref:GATA-type domain-containing protein n=1 Tax=Rhododendron griersonianum TaxID=479676 RepID=A0AAV6L2R5_9ERIC|nr:hypothetical protein RHGRI_008949 [Rhododendron griersonianum]
MSFRFRSPHSTRSLLKKSFPTILFLRSPLPLSLSPPSLSLSLPMTDHDQDSSLSPFAVDQHDQLYSTAKSQACLSSSHSGHFFTYPIRDRGGSCHRERHQLNYQEAANLASRGSNHHQTPEGESDRGFKPSLRKKQNGSHENQSDDHNGSIEWMPTKKRLILKMMEPDPYRPGRDNQTPTNAQLIKFEDQKYLQAASSSSLESTKHGSNSIRVCSDCNTTKTPLWRSGPRGPKSLCNACGIRQRKARRAMAAAAPAAAAANGSTLEAGTSPTKSTAVQLKDKRATNDGYITKYKKGSRISTTTTTTTTSHGKKKKICFEEFLISLSNNLAFHRVFPQDEKEAAILLMALSCDLVHG